MLRILTLFATLLVAPLVAADATRPVAGTLDSIGSDTLAGLMLRWGERLEDRHPGVRLQLNASGSATAPPALASGTTRIGPMSRPMTASERDDFIARQGYPPTRVPVAMDALAVFVHRHNPLAELSLDEVDALFSDTLRCGARRPVAGWEALIGEHRAVAGGVALHGRSAASGTYGVFKRTALCGGDYRPTVNEHPGSSAVVKAVAESPRGIGYAGLAYLTPGVRAVSLREGDGPAVPPSEAAILSGDYPLSRTLYLYLNLPPGERLPALEAALLDLVLSPAGQETVRELGFVPLPEARLAATRARLGLPATLE